MHVTLKQLKKNSWLCAFQRGLLCLLAQTSTVFGLSFNLTLSSLTNHNTSANPAYNQANFPANFGTASWVNQNGTTMPVDPSQMDESLNPITPGHVSKMDVHTLIPSRPDLRWFAHATPWFGAGSHINIGLTNNSTSYVAAMVTDMKNRGFNGVIIDWYGAGSSEDQVTLKIQSYLKSIPGNTFTYIVMIDHGATGSDTNSLVSALQYCQSQYFNDTNYEHEPLSNGNPIVMFFGVRSAIGSAAMSSVKAYTGGNMVWVEQGTGYLGESWEDQCFEWTDQYNSGVNASDPFNLSAVTSFCSTMRNSSKKAFGAMCGNFNGTLTKSVGWSEGKYLPSSNGVCLVQRAASINSAIPGNVTRMQWPTWSDWEEGTQVESGIENNFALTGRMITTNLLAWTIAAGDERTIDHYEIYASFNGASTAFLGSVPAGVYQTNLGQVGLAPGTYQLYVDAVGKPCIRDHMCPAVSGVLATGPAVTQQPANASTGYGGGGVFSVSATGAPPLFYTWYDQSNNVAGYGSSLTISNATQSNGFYAVVSNPYGNTTSSPALLLVQTAPVVVADLQPLAQTVWQGDPVSFAVTGGGMPPLSYQWQLNGQSIPGATNSAYSLAALPGTNFYCVAICNGQGCTSSSTGKVVGVAATFLNPSNYMSMRLTFSGYTNGETLVDFPVLVRLNTNLPGFSYAQFASPATGADLRFAGANGRALPFQIDQWNPAGESLVWVQVPSLATTNDYITACWGNSADSAMPACATNGAVWSTLSGSNNCLLVYHLSQSGFPFADSTLQYPANSGVAPASATGMTGRGCAFNGSSQFLDAGLVKLGKTFTLSAWVNIASAATSEQTIWCNKQGGWNTAGFDFYVNSWQANDGVVYFDTADGSGGNVAPRTAAHAVSFGQWHLLTGTMDGVNGSVHVYVDGVDQTISNAVDTAFQVTNYVRCGSLLTGTPGASGSSCFNGSMDEARIESSVRSPAWVWASWATVAGAAFASYGPVIPAAVTLYYQLGNGQMVLTWATGTLQSAAAANGPYSDIAASSAGYTVVPSGTQRYFRVRVQ